MPPPQRYGFYQSPGGIIKNRNTLVHRIKVLLIISLAIGIPFLTRAQTPAPNDDSLHKAQHNLYVNQFAKVYATKANSLKRIYPDTSLTTFFRYNPYNFLNKDLGNVGSPLNDWWFKPYTQPGLTLGYTAFEPYRWNADSLDYYQTNKPFTVFNYLLGSKAEQVLNVLHTQNINSRFNIAVQYKKISSPGVYLAQRTIHDNASLTTHYASKNEQYQLKLGVAYSKMQNYENGGIRNEGDLDSAIYTDRRIVPVVLPYDNSTSNAQKSNKSFTLNQYRDFSISLEHSYSFGKKDTILQPDSVHKLYVFTPRFSVVHRFKWSSAKYHYLAKRPDSLTYVRLGNYSFKSTDSVEAAQYLNKIDNFFGLRTTIGSNDKPLLVEAGIGIEQNSTILDARRNNYSLPYVAGRLQKEALAQGQWGYGADVKFYFAGITAGNFSANGFLEKDLGKNWGNIRLNAMQTLQNAPLMSETYQSLYYKWSNDFRNQSFTRLGGSYSNPKYRLGAGVQSWVMGNYIYMDTNLAPKQTATAFSILQVNAYKGFYFRGIIFNNEFFFQQVTGDAPLHIPSFMGRHQLMYEDRLFQKKLLYSIGAEIRYHTQFYADAYSQQLQQFVLQYDRKTANKPELTAFVSMRIKKIRVFFSADQLNQLIWKENVVRAYGLYAPGMSPIYPGTDVRLNLGISYQFVN